MYQKTFLLFLYGPTCPICFKWIEICSIISIDSWLCCLLVERQANCHLSQSSSRNFHLIVQSMVLWKRIFSSESKVVDGNVPKLHGC
jgi:hypothetical protein